MIIGIGGVSNSGKSALAEKIKDQLEPGSVMILCQDDYVRNIKDIPKIKDHIDWEIPESMDFERFYKSIIKAAQSFDIVLAEGLLVFFKEKINKLFDARIFIEINRKTFTNRKKDDMRWGIEKQWYIDHIWDSFIAYGYPPSEKNVLHINGEEAFDLPGILDFINSFEKI